MAGARLGVDVGGTFTDLVALVEGGLITAKVPSTPDNQAHGVVRALEVAQLAPGAVASFTHGSTVATNALLERRGARTALITTEGFRDVIEIGRQNRPALYDLARDRPATLVPRELRFTVRERMSPDGVLVPLDEGSLRATVDDCREANVEAVAVCLLFGFLHPEHEQRIGEALRETLPGVQVSLSSEVLPEFREYERCSTTVCNSYLTPRLAAYLRSLANQVGALGLPTPLVMQSSGGAAEIETAAAHAASCILSGPAGGVVGAAWVAGLSGFHDLLTFDMGGTSTDVAPVLGGNVQTTTESVVAGVPIKLPMVDVHTVSAGGGSIAWVDAGGALRVGPHSAGADPGPAAYGRGGNEPTVTDANLFLGYLPDGAELGGEVRLDRDRAAAALRRAGEQTGLDVEETARAIICVADAEMVRALRVISIERGLDPRELSLVAFGGAGGLHACALAEDLDIGRILVPLAAGVLSALGLAISDVRRDHVYPFLAALEAADPDDVEACFAELEARAREQLVNDARLTLARLADVRYQGQSFELTVSAEGLEGLAGRFHVEHQRRYGHRMEDEVVELVNLRLIATVPRDKPDFHEESLSREATAARRRAIFDGTWRDIDVYQRADLGAGAKLRGPVVVEFAESTLVVRPSWQATVDGVGTLILERQR
ncbi:MAG TPA: hydantoinase/oxoprolinase family protein [Actinomycetes bacterium]|jgi:N-methylhydantoinase A|nr:hydantoinase/oxoprolinase family protein [Actinomycetes bacterium]